MENATGKMLQSHSESITACEKSVGVLFALGLQMYLLIKKISLKLLMIAAKIQRERRKWDPPEIYEMLSTDRSSAF